MVPGSAANAAPLRAIDALKPSRKRRSTAVAASSTGSPPGTRDSAAKTVNRRTNSKLRRGPSPLTFHAARLEEALEAQAEVICITEERLRS